MSPRRLGLHFLNDRNILRRIVDALEPEPGDVVLEIGPGKGSLTRELLGRGVTVVAIEKDARLATELDGGSERLTVVQGDALEVDWSNLVDPPFKVAGNIPYSVTSPLLDKALTPPLPQRVVFLVQEEVANRITARPGSKAYGGLTVGVQALCRAEKLFVVRAGAFEPPPKVQSALLRLMPLAEPLIDSSVVGQAFRRFVTACFSQRRKQLRNVLRAVTGKSAPEVTAGLAALGIDPAARPETLAPSQFVALLHWRTAL